MRDVGEAALGDSFPIPVCPWKVRLGPVFFTPEFLTSTRRLGHPLCL
jgi:hypothetical protein